MSEQWRPVVGFENRYEVSDIGRVASLPSKTWPTRRILALVTRKRDGYVVASLWRRGKQYNRKVHQLVCEAFNGSRPDGLVTRHLDGVPSNNTPGNLAWGNASENGYDRVRHGTHPGSRKTHCKSGHEFTRENTYSNSVSGARQCRECKRKYNRKAAA